MNSSTNEESSNHKYKCQDCECPADCNYHWFFVLHVVQGSCSGAMARESGHHNEECLLSGMLHHLTKESRDRAIISFFAWELISLVGYLLHDAWCKPTNKPHLGDKWQGAELLSTQRRMCHAVEMWYHACETNCKLRTCYPDTDLYSNARPGVVP
jgi:hypothetical protein